MMYVICSKKNWTPCNIGHGTARTESRYLHLQIKSLCSQQPNTNCDWIIPNIRCCCKSSSKLALIPSLSLCSGSEHAVFSYFSAENHADIIWWKNCAIYSIKVKPIIIMHKTMITQTIFDQFWTYLSRSTIRNIPYIFSCLYCAVWCFVRCYSWSIFKNCLLKRTFWMIALKIMYPHLHSVRLH